MYSRRCDSIPRVACHFVFSSWRWLCSSFSLTLSPSLPFYVELVTLPSHFMPAASTFKYSFPFHRCTAVHRYAHVVNRAERIDAELFVHVKVSSRVCILHSSDYCFVPYLTSREVPQVGASFLIGETVILVWTWQSVEATESVGNQEGKLQPEFAHSRWQACLSILRCIERKW